MWRIWRNQRIIIGLLAAFTLAFYSVFPKNLLAKYGSVYTYAWAQFSAGILMNFLHPLWKISEPIGGADLTFIPVLGWQLIFGTMVSYPSALPGGCNHDWTGSCKYAVFY